MRTIADQEERDQVEAFLELVRAARRIFLDESGNGLSADGQRVMDDLAQFCHARASTHCFDDVNRSDPLASAQLEGRRQVYLRIMEWTEITDRDLRQLFERG